MSHDEWIKKHNCERCQNSNMMRAKKDWYSFSYMCLSTGYCNNEFNWFVAKNDK